MAVFLFAPFQETLIGLGCNNINSLKGYPSYLSNRSRGQRGIPVPAIPDTTTKENSSLDSGFSLLLRLDLPFRGYLG